VAPGGERAGEPRNYAYGHFPLYLLVALAELAAAGARWFGETSLAFPHFLTPIYTVGRHLNEYGHMTLVARAISATADLGTLLVVYSMTSRLGRAELGGASLAKLAGLLAAAAYAFAVLPIQLSHYGSVDALLTLCVTAAVALAARYAEGGGRATWALAGVMAGFAVGSKFSAVLLAVPLLVAAVYAPLRVAKDVEGILPGKPRPFFSVATLATVTRRLAGVAVLALVTFVATNPFAILELPQYISVIAGQNAMVSGVMDAPYTRQYIGTVPYWYFIQQLSQWGLGWPLGIAAWAGLVWAVVRFAQRHVSPVLVVFLGWAFPYFATTGAFHTKYLRYMAPLLPFLLAFAAVMAVGGLRWLVRRRGARGRVAWAVGAAAVLGFTLTWALTFTGVYRQEHPWITASLWMYENVPEGSKILSEGWDDALPLAMDEYPGRPPARQYTRVELPLWDADDARKLDTLAAELSSGHYLVLASNRLFTPIQRLSGRYPMASQYYRMLFAGELGYEQVAEFAVYPRLGGLVVPDDNADESFTVYDHPRTFVFHNSAQHSESTLRILLKRYLPSGQQIEDQPRAQKVPGLASYRTQAPAPDAPLTLDVPVDTLPVVADFRWNPPASNSPLLAALLWWLVVSLFGWLAWPLLFPLLRGLRDRGFGLARAAGWLMIGWVHWTGVSLGVWENRLDSIAPLLLLLAIAGRVAWAFQREEMGRFWSAHRRWLWAEEAVFGAAFLAFVGVRLMNPDLWQPWNGGEKFMELAFLNATLRSPTFPPFDPYFAGGVINYYYYGLYLVTLPIKLTGIAAEVAFNLAIPSLFATTATGVFSVAGSLARWGRAAGSDTRTGETKPSLPVEAERTDAGQTGDAYPWWQAGITVLLTLVLGNMRGLEWMLGATRQVLQGGGLPTYDYWAASRVIPFTINEFPLWTFVFADLHPHMIAIPFGILVVGLALNWLQGTAPGMRHAVLNLALLVLALGALGPLNTWDIPVYAILVSAVLLFSGWNRGRLAGLGTALMTTVAVLAAAGAAYLPFYLNYKAMVPGELGLVQAGSPLKDWLSVWGFFLFLGASYAAYTLLIEWRRERATGGGEAEGLSAHQGRLWLFGLLAAVGSATVLAAVGRPTAALATLPMFMLLPLIFRRRETAELRFAALLLALGFAIVAGTEVVYLKDFLDGGDWYRMNTLFKFSVPAWLFLGLGSGMALVQLWRAAFRGPVWLAVPWQATAVVLIVGGLAFLIFGIRARVDDRFPGARPPFGTLDGMAYMSVGRYTWPGEGSIIELWGDYQAIRWLLDSVEGSPVVAEAPAGSYNVTGRDVGYDYYRAGGLRVASLTGLPTFVGHHQYEQRPGDQVSTRTYRAQEFFRTTNLAVARALIRDLHIGYVYVGQLERVLFGPESLRKFDALVELGEVTVAYRNPSVTIYRVER
jgi:YYY domain-containing protein